MPQAQARAATRAAARSMQRLQAAGADYKFALLRALTLIVLGLAAAAPLRAATTVAHCASAGARDALAARALQTDLMVAALVCNRRDDYNAFVRRHRPALAAHGGALRAWFLESYGRAGEGEMNRFVTRLANEASGASNRDRALYCRVTGSLFDGLVSADLRGLEGVIRNPLLAVRHGVAACDAVASPAPTTDFSARR